VIFNSSVLLLDSLDSMCPTLLAFFQLIIHELAPVNVTEQHLQTYRH